MFKLQRLEITGFKSFADHTEIVFTGSGITAVVGPNGCGKSNVSDAISWVLGEQRAKSLRGGEMKDVVFQGSKHRKPSGMSEVILHLVRDENFVQPDDGELHDIDQALNELDENAVDIDEIEALEPIGAESQSATAAAQMNESGPFDAVIGDESGFETETVQAAQVGSVQTVERTIKTKRHWRPRSFALDFAPGEAVSVTRRLYLSGESEYQLNGKACRLRDIQDLFAGTGLSGAHYAIIEQGRIGQILSAKPGDRRSLIEEAAGISKFRTRQRAAEARLDGARTNLGRITDIVSEIDKQANSLRRQASKTRRYIVLQEEFKTLLRKTFAAESGHFSRLTAELRIRLDEAVNAERGLAAKVTAGEEASRTATAAARKAEEDLAELRQRLSENALERDRIDREHKYQIRQVADLTARADALAAESRATELRIENVDIETERLLKEDKKESAEAGEAEFTLREAETLYSEKILAAKQIEADLEKRRSELLEHTAAVERFSEIDRQLKLNSDRSAERLEGLKREQIRADQTLADHRADVEKTAAELIAERDKLHSLQAERVEIAAASAIARETLEKSEAELKEAQNEHLRANNRLETLRELEEKGAVYDPQIQKLIAAKDAMGIRPLGVLADFFSVEESAEKAVESLFGNFLQTVLVEKASDAAKIAEWLGSNEVGRVATLVVENTDMRPAPRLNTADDPLIEDVIGVSEDLKTLLQSVFPREMSARLCKDLYAVKEPNELLINYSGDTLTAGKLFISGRRAKDGKNDSLLAFKREMAGLAKDVKKLESESEKRESTVASDRKELTVHEEKAVDLQSLIIIVERGLLGLEVHERSAKQEVERAERHGRIVAEETAQVEKEISEIGAKIAEANEMLVKIERLRVEARDDVERVTQVYGEARTLSELENEIVNEKRTFAATSLERRRSVRNALKRVESERKELDTRLALLEIERNETAAKIDELKGSIAELATRVESATADTANEKSILDEILSAVDTARTKADSTINELASLNHDAAEAMNERAAIEVRRTEAVTELRAVNEKCIRELNMSLDELAAVETIDPELELETARIEVDEIRRRLEGFGAINMLAVEELAEAEERLLFLTSQRQDIIDSMGSAQEALREIKERSRAKFKEAFEAINANFVEFFHELFGGGRGEMTLLESDDILEAGIEIVAQPPGKRLQNILLLSGGEKAMTAIALVLAIFKYRPSPFCLLDEVDAPLDEANVGRFVNKITEMAEKTQFIVITHNKRTMESARALYGVTMQEAGVSKVVSVKFE